MAGIDKIYGTNEQYDEFYSWAQKKEPSILDYFYPRDDFVDEGYGRPITNFPENVDMWLLKYCPLEFVVSRIRQQYNL